MHIVTASEMQAMDRKTIEERGIPGRLLMENAGRGATRSFLTHLYKEGTGRVGVIAGRGNNGGDGFVMARYLAQRNIPVEVFLLASAERVQGDARTNLDLLPAAGVPVIEMADGAGFTAQRTRMEGIDYWIDAILGTGLNADVRGFFKTVIAFINDTARPVFAVDIPSGLHTDTGQPCGISVYARATATFAFAKPGHLIYPGAERCGTVDIIDIGIPPEMIQVVDPKTRLVTGATVQALLPERTVDTHKGRTGHVLIAAGAEGKTGAAAMSATSALRIGAGLVSLAVPQRLNAVLEAMVTEVMTIPVPDEAPGIMSAAAVEDLLQAMGDKQCLAIGPGMGTAPTTAQLIQEMLVQSPLPVVVDADGLNNLVGRMDLLKKRKAATVLTPHPGEMARLAGCSVPDIQKDRIAAVRSMAVDYGVCVVLKGARTLIGTPGGAVWINPTGNQGMACGGMGDVLTGAVAGLVAQGCDPVDAAICAVYLHGLAADLLNAKAPWGYLATEVMHALPTAIGKVLADPPKPIVNGPLL